MSQSKEVYANAEVGQTNFRATQVEAQSIEQNVQEAAASNPHPTRRGNPLEQ